MAVRAVALVVVSAAVSALGCGREAGRGSSRKPAGAAAATAPSNDDSSERHEAARREDVNDERAEPADAGLAGLTPATAVQLRAVIRASRRKGTLVNAWASWCGPCRREVPMLQALAANLKPQGIQIVLVSMDEPKDEGKARSFLNDNAITLPSYLVAGSLEDFKDGINPSWPGMLPASFLFDGRATLVHFWGGEAFENEIVPVVDDFVAGRPIATETRYGLAPGKVAP